MHPVFNKKSCVLLLLLFSCFSPPCFPLQEQKSAVKKNPASRPLGMIIKVKPQAKKARLDEENTEEISKAGNTPPNDKTKSSEPIQALNGEANKSREVALTGLVSYSDESDDDL